LAILLGLFYAERLFLTPARTTLTTEPPAFVSSKKLWLLSVPRFDAYGALPHVTPRKAWESFPVFNVVGAGLRQE